MITILEDFLFSYLRDIIRMISFGLQSELYRVDVHGKFLIESLIVTVSPRTFPHE